MRDWLVNSRDLLTPPLPGLEVDATDVPQNLYRKGGDDGGGTTKSTVANKGQVVVEAQYYLTF